MIRDKRVLLTGGAGFIGTALAQRLVDYNQVVVYDSGHRDSLKDSGLLTHPNLHVIRGDVLDAAEVRKAMQGCQIVVHLAAIAGVDTVLKMPVTTMKVNIIGTYTATPTWSLSSTVAIMAGFVRIESSGKSKYFVPCR